MKTAERSSGAPGFLRAVVVGLGAPIEVGPKPTERRLWVELEGERQHAVLAVPAPYRPTLGDRVLVIGTGELAVVGVLEGHRSALPLADGGEAQVSDTGALEVRDAAGRLRVRCEDDAVVLGVEAGDLVLEAPAGRVAIRGRDVQMEASRDLELGAVRALKQRASRIEVDADQLFERTRDCIREARELVLTRAGSMRTLVKKGLTIATRRTSMRSEKDTEIDGRRVLLG